MDDAIFSYVRVRCSDWVDGWCGVVLHSWQLWYSYVWEGCSDFYAFEDYPVISMCVWANAVIVLMWGKGTVLDRDGWHRWMMWYWLNVHGSCDALICEKGAVICAYRNMQWFEEEEEEEEKKEEEAVRAFLGGGEVQRFSCRYRMCYAWAEEMLWDGEFPMST